MSTNFIWVGIFSVAILTLAFIIFLYCRKHYIPIKQKEFYNDGCLKREYRILNGQIHGQDTIYYPTGEINKIQHWSKGKLEGSFVVYFKTGQEYIVGNYSDGVYKGEYIVNDMNGNVILRKDY